MIQTGAGGTALVFRARLLQKYWMRSQRFHFLPPCQDIPSDKPRSLARSVTVE